MFKEKEYMTILINQLKDAFRDRLLYVGLQGSYMRGEATENSDIDIVVILDKLCVDDLDRYRKIIGEIGNSEKSCGFICGKEEMMNWNPMEICHLIHGTEDYFGTLDELVPEYNKQDVINFIKLSADNLYHEISHRYVHSDAAKNKRKLAGAYKNIFFILQNIYFLKTGVFAKTKQELCVKLVETDLEVMETALKLQKSDDYDFEEAFELLFKWCQRIIREVQ